MREDLEVLHLVYLNSYDDISSYNRSCRLILRTAVRYWANKSLEV